MTSLKIARSWKVLFYLESFRQIYKEDLAFTPPISIELLLTEALFIDFFHLLNTEYIQSHYKYNKSQPSKKTFAKKKKKKSGLRKRKRLFQSIRKRWTKKLNNSPEPILRRVVAVNFRRVTGFRFKYFTRKRRPLKFMGALRPKRELRAYRRSYVYNALNPAHLKISKINLDYRTLSITLLNIYLGGVSKAFLGYSTDWLFVNPRTLLKQKHHRQLTLYLYSKKRLQGLYSSQKTFLLWYIKLTFFRDPAYLAILMFNWLYRSNLKTHKKVFFVLINLLQKMYPLLFKYKKILGFFVYFKGKLAKKGSVRKEKIFKKMGRVAMGTKSLRGSVVQYQAPTLTGTIGAAIGIFFASMLTLSLLYLTCYLLTLLSLFVYLTSHNFLQNTTKVSFSSLVAFISEYTADGILFRVLLAHLSGVAPAFLFYLKFNLVITALEYTHIISAIIIFSNLLLATFFYLRLLSKSNHKLSQKMHKTILGRGGKGCFSRNKRLYWGTYFCLTTIIISTLGVNILPGFFVILEQVFM